MPQRDTRTGAVLEEMILPALRRGGYTFQTQVVVGSRLGQARRRHKVDVVASDDTGAQWLVSLKWQQVSGTAEQKVPFEVISLAEAIRQSSNRYKRAYIVLGGPGWSWREFYVGGGLKSYLRHVESVVIVNLESFIATANQGQL